MDIKNAVWQKVDKVVSSKVALAIFTLISYAEIYLSVAGSFFEANRLLFGTSFFALLLDARTREEYAEKFLATVKNADVAETGIRGY